MTRFVGDAIGVRSGGGSRRGPSKKERERALAEFARTGRHPDLEGGGGPSGLALPGRLPDRVLTRPHVYLDVEGGGAMHRLVIELFADLPSTRAAAAAFAARCRPGADGAFAGTPLAGLVPGTALFGGGRAPARAVVAAPGATPLTHCEAGAVSISTTGGSWAVVLGPTPSLDTPSWAVCGRVTPESLGAAAALGGVAVTGGGATTAGAATIPLGARPPATPHTVKAAGLTDARGAHEAADTAPPAAPVSLEEAAAAARQGVEAALAAGLAGEEKEGGKAEARPPAGKKRGLDELLGGGSGSDEDDSSSSGGE